MYGSFKLFIRLNSVPSIMYTVRKLYFKYTVHLISKYSNSTLHTKVRWYNFG